MDSLWRDAIADGWELEPGGDRFARIAPGAPLRQAELGDVAVGHQVMLLVLIGHGGASEPVRDRVLVEVVRVGRDRVDRPHVGRVVDGPRQTYCPFLNEGQEVTFLPEHVAAVRLLGAEADGDQDGGRSAKS